MNQDAVSRLWQIRLPCVLQAGHCPTAVLHHAPELVFRDEPVARGVNFVENSFQFAHILLLCGLRKD